MLKKLETLTYTSKEYNEDTFFVSDEFAFIIDGSSPLVKTGKSNFLTHKFVSELKNKLAKNLEDKNISIKKCLDLSLKDVLKEDLKKEFIKNDISSTISVIRQVDKNLEIYYLGDSPIIIEFNGGIKEFVSEDITKFDTGVLNKMVEISNAKNISVLESRNSKKIKEILDNNRNLKNKNDGYFILDTIGIGIENGHYFSFKLKDVKRALICSDGFSQVYDTLKIFKDFKETMLLLKENTLEDVLEKILKVQNEDKDLNKYPRFTKTDDITAVFIGEIDE